MPTSPAKKSVSGSSARSSSKKAGVKLNGVSSGTSCKSTKSSKGRKKIGDVRTYRSGKLVSSKPLYGYDGSKPKKGGFIVYDKDGNKQDLNFFDYMQQSPLRGLKFGSRLRR